MEPLHRNITRGKALNSRSVPHLLNHRVALLVLLCPPTGPCDRPHSQRQSVQDVPGHRWGQRVHARDINHHIHLTLPSPSASCPPRQHAVTHNASLSQAACAPRHRTRKKQTVPPTNQNQNKQVLHPITDKGRVLLWDSALQS